MLIALLAACTGSVGADDSTPHVSPGPTVDYVTYTYDCSTRDGEWGAFVMPTEPVSIMHIASYGTDYPYWVPEDDLSWSDGEDVAPYIREQCADDRNGGRVVVGYLPE